MSTKYVTEFEIRANDVPSDISIDGASCRKGHALIHIEGGGHYRIRDAERIVAALSSVIRRTKAAHRRLHGESP